MDVEAEIQKNPELALDRAWLVQLLSLWGSLPGHLHWRRQSLEAEARCSQMPSSTVSQMKSSSRSSSFHVRGLN